MNNEKLIQDIKETLSFLLARWDIENGEVIVGDNVEGKIKVDIHFETLGEQNEIKG